MNIDGSDRKLVSTRQGPDDVQFLLPGRQASFYASTHLGGDACPPVPGHENGYVWPIYATYDIFSATPTDRTSMQLTKTPGYDAEATIARDGRIVFTSVRDGDMDIYSMNGDGSDVKPSDESAGSGRRPVLFSRRIEDCVPRPASRQGKELDDYFALLKKELWKPAGLDVFVMNRDGSNLQQVTKGLGGANWAPFFTPDGKRIIFASNMKDPARRELRPLPDQPRRHRPRADHVQRHFDGFPMFSPDGKKLVFASNRHSTKEPTRTSSSPTGNKGAHGRYDVTDVAIGPEDRGLAAMTHLSGLAGYIIPLGGVLVPIIIWLTKQDSPIISAIARQAILLNVTAYLMFIVGFLMLRR